VHNEEDLTPYIANIPN